MTTVFHTWKDIFKLCASYAASEFMSGFRLELMHYFPHHKLQVKPHLCPWFSNACAAGIVHRDHLFCFLPAE